MKKLYYILLSMRPNQWTKNLVLFAGLIFSRNLTNAEYFLKSLEAAVIFCLLSGVIYIINDITDIEKDKLHESKKKRPIVAGKLRVQEAAFAAILGSAIGLILTALVGQSFVIISCIFFAFNLFYSFVLKKIVLLDVMSISVSFILRAIAGVEALKGLDTSIELSPWLLICTLFLSLFLAFCKRRYELVSLGEASRHRHALAEYSTSLIDQLVGITAAGSVLSYSIYTIWPDTVEKFGTTNLVYTIPLVLIGVMRYLYLVYSKEMGGSPTDHLLREKFLLIDVFAWILLVIAIFYVI
ncbi:MAG: decaprenyl-phosphate phosphoribosyltransferase [Candidatus Latescibacteria bacterium]|nr:decaprenyl-phosphate phosphoribosyltransferase [Candidatus Latescibacterota bacterium]NIM65262.1 decaprenyl-phosphate phosphoribosyltransferase [Candidatus Latescibacterota bacterium]NIO01777.1 decaprenyl-phosphate phosphoribosyltransferase [Candidatus Latescibacterota bacterium]NIO28294.1 decaprenyl-phosphate phosphoribosyltransferase [Candidatus Latescibacterota bacterium]NIO55841.1 decaprenyl-phosphate phosphoribosyltransferase [Candidatus Latescibacterota bacterium]